MPEIGRCRACDGDNLLGCAAMLPLRRTDHGGSANRPTAGDRIPDGHSSERWFRCLFPALAVVQRHGGCRVVAAVGVGLAGWLSHDCAGLASALSATGAVIAAGQLLLLLAPFYLMTAVTMSGAFEALRDDRVRIGECLSHGFTRLVQVVAVSAASAAAALMMMAAIIVPAFIVFFQVRLLMSNVPGLLLFFVVIGFIAGIVVASAIGSPFPWRLSRGQGVLESLQRSAQLTEGYRFHIFFLALTFTVLTIAFLIAVSWAARLASAGFDDPAAAGQIAWAIAFAAGALVHAVGSVLTCVCYFELRRGQGEFDVDDVAAVFE